MVGDESHLKMHLRSAGWEFQELKMRGELVLKVRQVGDLPAFGQSILLHLHKNYLTAGFHIDDKFVATYSQLVEPAKTWAPEEVLVDRFRDAFMRLARTHRSFIQPANRLRERLITLDDFRVVTMIGLEKGIIPGNRVISYAEGFAQNEGFKAFDALGAWWPTRSAMWSETMNQLLLTRLVMTEFLPVKERPKVLQSG